MPAPNVTEQLDFKVNAAWKEFAGRNPWAAFIPEFAKDSSGQRYMRGRDRTIAYKIKDMPGKQTPECAQCGGEVLAAKVAHPVHDGLFPLSGSGECRYETVPYCPRCEVKPAFHGAPIKEN